MFTKVWSKISDLARSRKSASGKKALKRPLSLESLEDRRLLSINPTQINLHNSNLLINGSDAADIVTVTEAVSGTITVRLESGGDSLSVNFAKSQVQLVSFFGKEGNDQFSNSTDIATRAYGDGGNDTLVGGSGDDELLGGDGGDTILGGEGNDKLYGEAGADLLNGQGGDDSLWGGVGNDKLYGGLGEDRLLGEEGNDQLFGQGGNDSLAGADGDDSLDGGAGNDLLGGGNGNDALVGGSGDDQLLGDAGTDDLKGDAGDDTLWGGTENDTLYGGDGNDRLLGEEGKDQLLGEGGIDNVAGGDGDDILDGGYGSDNLSGGNGDDIIHGGDDDDILNGDAGSDSLFGEQGDDSLWGGTENDSLYGGDGDDRLFGQVGNDRLIGQGGNDSLAGGEDDDKISGGDGNDILTGNLGNDLLSGNSGDDQLWGDEGDDVLLGEEGNDALSGGDGVDLLYGREGNDSLSGDEGNDIIHGNEGDDSLYGGDGDDVLYGHDGADRLYGGGGNDHMVGSVGANLIVGGEGDDTLIGGNDDDALSGGLGNDVILGLGGDDQITGDAGLDLLFGDEGNDTISGGDDRDGLNGGDGNDTLYGDLGNDVISGGNGDDQIEGGEGLNILFGDKGNDSIWGGDDNDLLYGGEGDDRLLGGFGTDRLLGEDGNDSISGGDGDDTIDGGEGNDTLGGNNGRDVIYGGAGNDVLMGDADSDFLFGNLGQDSILGGDGDDVLMGEQHSDTLDGGIGNDVLVGGFGFDSLDGSLGDDLLIGGQVNYGLAELDLLLAQWSSASTYAARVAAIANDEFAAYLELEETVFDDYVADSIRGRSGNDWFFVTGVVNVYNPVHDHLEGQQAHGDEHHDAHVIDHLPVLEGFELIDALDHLEDVTSGETVSTLVPHADDESKRREHLSLFELVRYDEVTHYAIASGNWSDASTWHDGIVPAADARVLIPIGVQVTVDKILTTEIATIRVDGKLSFATQTNTWLKVDTIIVTDVGSFEMGTEANPIAASKSARLTFTNNGAIDRSWDPFGISRGLITHGSVDMYGAEVTSAVELAQPVLAGTSTLILASPTVGWKVGDKLVIAGTQLGTDQTEERIIRFIFGNLVVVDPLQYSHVAQTGQSVHVANLTRNVVIDSEGSAVERRGHVMFMHNRDVQINYASFYKLGRTNKAEVINDPVVDANWNLVPGTGTNPRARYAVHFHRTGTSIADAPAVVNGSVVEDNLGWGFVNHSSHVDFTNNAAYDVFGAAFVTEVGDEIGTFRGNIAMSIRGSGEKLINRNTVQDHGHTGDGFWFQGAGITVVDNVAANAQGSAFIYFTRGLTFGDQPAMYLAANLPDPSIADGATGIAIDFVPVREFSGNVGYASGTGLMLRYNLRDATHNAQSILEDSTFWNNEIGVNVPYSENVVLRNLVILNDFSQMGPYGVVGNGASKDITYDNLYVSGYTIGIDVARLGYSVVNGGRFATRYGITVRPAAQSGRTVLIQGQITMLPIPLPGSQVEVDMRFDVATLNGEDYAPIDHLFTSSTTTLNYGPYNNRRLYYSVQAPDAIPFPVAQSQIPSDYVGLTTLELRNRFGLTVGGGLAPAQTVTVPSLKGLLSVAL